MLARTDLAASVPDIEWAGAVLVIETELVDEAPILDLRVRKGARRHGTKVVTLTSHPSTLDPNAAAALRFAPGSAEAALGALAAELGSPRAGLSAAELAEPRRAVGRACQPAVPTGAASEPAKALSEAAAMLRDAPEVVVIFGERVAHGARGKQAVDALLAVAGALGVQGTEGAGLIEIPAAANGRGLREVGCLPNLGPGLKDAPDAGRGAAEIGRALGEGELSSLLLVGADPLRDFPERPMWEKAIDSAASVIAFADFRTDSLEESATVVFPAESYAEKEGTLTHPDGRLQRVRQAIAHPGDTRAGWWVLSELCERVGAGLGLAGAPAAFEQAAKAVAFWGGVGYDELAGKGARWQERGPSSSVPPAEVPDGELEEPPEPGDGLRLGAVPSLWSGPETENAPALRFLAPRQRAELNAGDAERLGVSAGDEVDVSVDGQSVRAVATVRAAVPPGSVFLISGTAEDNATALTERGAAPWWRSSRRERHREHAHPDRQGDRDLRRDPPDHPVHPLRRAQAARALPVAPGPQPRRAPRADAAAGRRDQADLQGAVLARHRGAVDDGAGPADLDRHRGGDAGDHPVRAAGRLGRRLRPLRHRRPDRRSCTSSRSARWRSTG